MTLLLAAIAIPAPAATLEIAIEGVRNAQGAVRVAVCSEQRFLEETCEYVGQAPARPGTTTVRIDNIPPGIYAAQAFHDEDMDGKIGRNLLGIPTEGLGFSNDARFRFGPPPLHRLRLPARPRRRTHPLLPPLQLLRSTHGRIPARQSPALLRSPPLRLHQPPPRRPQTRFLRRPRGSEHLRDYMKARAKELGIQNIRINTAGCLDRCELGPCLVIYPEGVWYRIEKTTDIDRILQTHLIEGNRATELMLPA